MFNKSIAAVAALFSTTSALKFNELFGAHLSGEAPIDHETFEWMWSTFEKEFGEANPNTNNLLERKSQFEVTIENIIAHNSNPNSTYKKGINQFSDMSDEEFNAYHRYVFDDSVKEEQHCSATRQSVNIDSAIDVPNHWDWRDHNGVSPVKNQGKCGSCWTFSTVGTLEAHSLIKWGSFDPLAEQQLVDCAGDFDNHGCNGGLPSHAFEYIAHAGGISTEDAYPYFAADHNCTVKSDTFALNVVGGSVNITEGDEVELMNAVFAHGPVSIAFQVVDGFRDYSEGVYTSDTCKNGTADVNHAVVAVGYGTCPKTGLDYWVVKNSWGDSWGDKGFFKIQRGVNMCGVAMCNSFPNDIQRLSHQNFLQM